MRRRRVTIQGMGRPALVRDVVTSSLSLSLWHQVRLPEELSSRVMDPILDARRAAAHASLIVTYAGLGLEPGSSR